MKIIAASNRIILFLFLELDDVDSAVSDSEPEDEDGEGSHLTEGWLYLFCLLL